MRPDGSALEQEFDWTAVFAIEVYKSARGF